jgi:hypothetical protein
VISVVLMVVEVELLEVVVDEVRVEVIPVPPPQ